MIQECNIKLFEKNKIYITHSLKKIYNNIFV